MSRRIPTRRMDPVIVTITELSPDEVNLLSAGGVINSNDLMVLTEADIVALLPAATPLLRRKVVRITEYLQRGNTIDAGTTIQDIMTELTAPPAPPAGAPIYQPDPTRNAPKVYVNALEEFSGAPIDWEDWSVKTSATLGQTSYAGLLTTAPAVNNVIENTRDRELFHMLKSATYFWHCLPCRREQRAGSIRVRSYDRTDRLVWES